MGKKLFSSNIIFALIRMKLKKKTIQHKIQLGCNDKSFVRRLCLVINNRGHEREEKKKERRKKITHFKA